MNKEFWVRIWYLFVLLFDSLILQYQIKSHAYIYIFFTWSFCRKHRCCLENKLNLPEKINKIRLRITNWRGYIRMKRITFIKSTFVRSIDFFFFLLFEAQNKILIAYQGLPYSSLRYSCCIFQNSKEIYNFLTFCRNNIRFWNMFTLKMKSKSQQRFTASHALV